MSKSLFQDEAGLCNDLSFLAHLPELCDITFMVCHHLLHIMIIFMMASPMIIVLIMIIIQ